MLAEESRGDVARAVRMRSGAEVVFDMREDPISCQAWSVSDEGSPACCEEKAAEMRASRWGYTC